MNKIKDFFMWPLRMVIDVIRFMFLIPHIIIAGYYIAKSPFISFDENDY